jgi:hypothetical protein
MARLIVVAAVSTIVSSLAIAPSPGNAAATEFVDPASVTADVPDRFTIDLVTVTGTGCRPGTAAIAPSPDREAFTVTYSDYVVSVGPGTGPVDFRKNCQINVQVHAPQGWTFGIAAADYRGFARIQQGARLVARARYYFQGMPESALVTRTFRGVFDDDWEFRDQAPVGAIVYKPCGETRLLNINTRLEVFQGNNPTLVDVGGMDSIDGSIKTLYHVSWKHCP